MNRYNYTPYTFQEEVQDNRFLPFLAGVAITAPLWLAAGRTNYCPNCIAPMPYYPQPYPPMPFPTPYPYPYPVPTPTLTPEVDYNTTIYAPSFPSTSGGPVTTGANIPYANPGFVTTTPFLPPLGPTSTISTRNNYF